MLHRVTLFIICAVFTIGWQSQALADCCQKAHPIQRGGCGCCPRPPCLEKPKPCPPTKYAWVVCHPQCSPKVRPCSPCCEEKDESCYRHDQCCDLTVKAVVCPPKVDICAPHCKKCKPACKWLRHHCCCSDLYLHKCKVCRPKFYLTYRCCGDEQHGEVEGMDIWQHYPGHGPK